MLAIIGALAALAASSAGAAPVDLPEPNPKSMSQNEIRSFNSKLDKRHRYFIVCKRVAATGSWVQRDVSCRTREQWVAHDVRGNQEARDIGEEMASKSWRTSDDPPG